MLPDGTYDAVVVDAEPVVAEASEPRDPARIRVDLAILAGAFKGEVVSVRAPAPERGDELDLLGIPATLVVDGGEPVLGLEP